MVVLLETGCTQQAGASNNYNLASNTFVAKLNESNSETKFLYSQLKIKEVNDFDNEPVIFNYVVGSDYVVEAILDKKDYVGKVIKQKEPNLGDLVAGFVYSFRTEKIFCSKETFLVQKNSQINSLDNFQIFVRVGIQDENYKVGQRYLLFLQQIPKDEKLSETYELYENTTYFRPFVGEKSIFPSEEGSMHSPPLKGILEMSDEKHESLIKKIETFCLAVNGEDRKTKIMNLQKLAKSDDEELKVNAVYAISILRKIQN